MATLGFPRSKPSFFERAVVAKLSMEYLGNLASLSYASGWAGEAKGSYFLTNIILNVYFTFINYIAQGK